MVFAAYKEHRTRRDARIKQARREARDAERTRMKRAIAAILTGEPNDNP